MCSHYSLKPHEILWEMPFVQMSYMLLALGRRNGAIPKQTIDTEKMNVVFNYMEKKR